MIKNRFYTYLKNINNQIKNKYSYIIFGLIFYFSFLILGHFTHGSSDAIARIELTRSLLIDGDVITAKYGAIKYSPLQSVLMIPAYASGYFLGIFSGQEDIVSQNIAYRFTAFFFNPVICSFIATIFFYFLKDFKIDLTIRILSTFLLIFGSLLFPYVRIMFSEPLSALLILLSLFYAYRSLFRDFRNNNRINFLFLGLLFLNNPIYVFYNISMFGALCFWALKNNLGRMERKKLCYDFLFISFIAGSTFLFYNYLRFGSIFLTGYSGEKFDNPIFIGMYGLLFSIGRGLIFYSPLTIICITYFIFKLQTIDREFRFIYGFLIILFIFFLLIYSKWGSWEGGWCWGPRFLLPFIPVLHLIFPIIAQSVKYNKDMLITYLFLAICVYAVGINGYEFLGIWQKFQGATFNSGETPYWYSVFNPKFSFLFNNWEMGLGTKRLVQFLLSVLTCNYLLLVVFKKHYKV
jgi:hypothetical protein